MRSCAGKCSRIRAPVRPDTFQLTPQVGPYSLPAENHGTGSFNDRFPKTGSLGREPEKHPAFEWVDQSVSGQLPTMRLVVPNPHLSPDRGRCDQSPNSALSRKPCRWEFGDGRVSGGKRQLRVELPAGLLANLDADRYNTAREVSHPCRVFTRYSSTLCLATTPMP